MYRINYADVGPIEPVKTYHIIWNVLLADKQLKLTEDVISSEKICHIVGILPHETDFLKLNSEISSMPYTILEYGEQHTTTIDKEKFNICGEFIDKLAKKDGNRNVLIFCNNGYQRSIPFLVYYLTNFHSNEIPTIEKALEIILSQVDRENYVKIMPSMVENVKKLLQ